MNIEHKKTALGDDSEIYKSRDNSFGKKDLRSLSGRQKLEYFRDYYLVKVLVAAAILIFAGALLNSMVFNRSNCLFALALINESELETAGTDTLIDALTDYLGVQGKNDYVSVENYYLEDAQMVMAYSAKNSAGAIDMILCPRDYFEEGAERGMFADLGEALPQELYSTVSDRLLEARVIDEQDNEGNALSYEDPRPYGIDISGSAHFAEVGGYADDLVLCVSGGYTNTENVAKVVLYFLE